MTRYCFPTLVKWGDDYDAARDMRVIEASSVAEALRHRKAVAYGIERRHLQVFDESAGRWRFVTEDDA